MIDNDYVTIRLSRNTKIEQALRYADVYIPEKVKKLSVTGVMTDWHFREILEKMGKTLQELKIENYGSKY